MQIWSSEGTMLLLSSLTHSGGQHHGTTTMLRREKFVQEDGSVEEVPVVSGNSIRGVLRDLGMRHMCAALGYGVDGKGLTLPAFHFLFSGGSLTSTGSKAIDVEYARKLRETIPLVSVFGGAVGNLILPGCLQVGKGLPICRELSHLLPARHASTVSIWEMLNREMYTRKDDAKDVRKRPLIEEQAQKFLEAAEAKAKPDDVVEETGAKQQMMYHTETLAAGTRLYWRVSMQDPSEVEMEAFLTCLVEFSRQPYLGGKSAVGHGEVALHMDNWLRIDSRAQATGEVALPAGNLYAKHLIDRAESIRATLGDIR